MGMGRTVYHPATLLSAAAQSIPAGGGREPLEQAAGWIENAKGSLTTEAAEFAEETQMGAEVPTGG